MLIAEKTRGQSRRGRCCTESVPMQDAGSFVIADSETTSTMQADTSVGFLDFGDAS